MRRIKILFLLIFSGLIFHQPISAQCSEAQNSDMAKYAELTRTGDAQGCSMCAWLANLYCIAENGLYENDKAELEKSIMDTKSNIQMMGDPICCPELLTKSIRWGNPSGSSEAGSDAKVENKTAADFQELMDEINHSVQTVQNLNLMEESYQELENNLKKIESEIFKNAKIGNFDYSTASEIESAYHAKLSNLNQLGQLHLEIKKRMNELGHAGANELINSEASGMGAVAKIGAFVDTFSYKKESETFLNNAKSGLNASKYSYLNALKNKDIKLGSKFSYEDVASYFKPYEESSDFSSFSNYTIIEGWYPDIAEKDFKKLTKDYSASSTVDVLGGYRQIEIYHKNSPANIISYRFKKSDKKVILIKKLIQKESANYSEANFEKFQQALIGKVIQYANQFKIYPSKIDVQEDLDKATTVETTSGGILENTLKNSADFQNLDEAQKQMILNSFKSTMSQSHGIIYSVEIVWKDSQKELTFHGAIMHNQATNILSLNSAEEMKKIN